ncbi:hypothetical protein [Pedosphaera parvula]|uniref:Glycoside hydrolase family 42 N-terminal domain-containing protein n=1 Tax=Pedosphaera parvula (strain Ellin514) TaxID=320771 RepID=B9XQT9_PEDPL|nr:hypothetical protein [Pedosphaera parvula]EEF57796.1 hypothetical protein Cflav_PD0896 [Pedosphaera parvula Ellin514]
MIPWTLAASGNHPAGKTKFRSLTALPMLLALFFATPNSASAFERWIYCAQNLWVDQNITNMTALMQRAAAAGYTHVLITDSKFGHLADMDARYFRNVDTLKKAAQKLGLEIVPAVFPVGYSNDILYQNPNLVEGLPARNVPLVVSNGVARVVPDPAIIFPGGDFADLSRWSWKDPNVTADNGTAKINNPNGANARIVQHLKVRPFRQYHISVRVKTQDFPTPPNVAVLAGNQSLNFVNLGVERTQGWKTHHVVFNSLTNTEVNVYFGVWGGTKGTLWWDDAVIEEVAFLNLIRRPGTPLTIRKEEGASLVESQDFTKLVDPLMGTKPWNGSYDVYHAPPALHTSLPDGTRLRASWYHAMTVYDGQAMICPSEQQTMALLQDQAERMHAAWGARGYFMSHDEIRVMNWCAACEARHLDAGEMLADNVRRCAEILRKVNPGGRIYVWSDMFDPHHNAHDNYFLVRGNLAGSWKGLDRDIIVVPWNYEQRDASLKFFAELGNPQLIAGYYDEDPARITNWLTAARPFPRIVGAMYTTWQNRFTDLEKFSQLISAFPAPEK